MQFLRNCICFRRNNAAGKQLHLAPTDPTITLPAQENNSTSIGPVNSSMPDWCQLPVEILELIFKKLNNSELYLIRFRSVCSTWRSSIPNYRHSHLPPLKLLKFSNPNMNNPSSGYLITQTAFLIKPPTHKQKNISPFLITIGPKLLYTDTQLLEPKCKPHHLKHLPFHFPPFIDFNRLSVVDIGHIFYIIETNQKVVTATCHGEQSLLIIASDLCGRPTMYRCGDSSWTKIPYLSQSLAYSGDICLYKGRPYVVDKTGFTVMIRPDLSIHCVAEPLFCGGDKLLVECECRLFLVDMYVSDDGSCDLRIDVYRLDENEKKWIKVANLGDNVSFLVNPISFSASASDLGVARLCNLECG